MNNVEINCCQLGKVRDQIGRVTNLSVFILLYRRIHAPLYLELTKFSIDGMRFNDDRISVFNNKISTSARRLNIIANEHAPNDEMKLYNFHSRCTDGVTFFFSFLRTQNDVFASGFDVDKNTTVSVAIGSHDDDACIDKTKRLQ